MQMTIQPASIAPLTDAPVMQAQLPTLPEDATHWPAFHLPKDLQATIMPQNPMVQSMKRKVVGADEEEKQPRICPDEDPEFVSQCYLFCSRNPADSCFISKWSSRMEQNYTGA
jgi:hypothetical protein